MCTTVYHRFNDGNAGDVSIYCPVASGDIRLYGAFHGDMASTIEHIHYAYRPDAVRRNLFNAAAAVDEWARKSNNAVDCPLLLTARDSVRRLERYFGAPARALVPDLYDFS